jgi:hypothetical protein
VPRRLTCTCRMQVYNRASQHTLSLSHSCIAHSPVAASWCSVSGQGIHALLLPSQPACQLLLLLLLPGESCSRQQAVVSQQCLSAGLPAPEQLKHVLGGLAAAKR